MSTILPSGPYTVIKSVPNTAWNEGTEINVLNFDDGKGMYMWDYVNSPGCGGGVSKEQFEAYVTEQFISRPATKAKKQKTTAIDKTAYPEYDPLDGDALFKYRGPGRHDYDQVYVIESREQGFLVTVDQKEAKAGVANTPYCFIINRNEYSSTPTKGKWCGGGDGHQQWRDTGKLTKPTVERIKATVARKVTARYKLEFYLDTDVQPQQPAKTISTEEKSMPLPTLDPLPAKEQQYQPGEYVCTKSYESKKVGFTHHEGSVIKLDASLLTYIDKETLAKHWQYVKPLKKRKKPEGWGAIENVIMQEFTNSDGLEEKSMPLPTLDPSPEELSKLMETIEVKLPADKFNSLEKIVSCETIRSKGIAKGIFEHNGKEYIITGSASKGDKYLSFFANEVIDLKNYKGGHKLYARNEAPSGQAYVFQKIKCGTRTLAMLQCVDFISDIAKQKPAAHPEPKQNKPTLQPQITKSEIRSVEYPGNKHSAGVWQKIVNQITPHDVFVSGCLGTCAVMQHKRPAQSNFGIDPNFAALQQHWPAIAGTEFVKADFLEWKKQFTFSKSTKPRWFIYLDPPYLMGTRRSQLPLYAHEPDAQWHANLISWAVNTTATSNIHIAISHYPCPEYDALVTEYGWRKITYKTSTHQGAVDECLYMNYPEPDELHEYTYLGNDRTERQNNKRMATNIVTKLNKLPALRRNKILAEVRELLQQGSATPPFK